MLSPKSMGDIYNYKKLTGNILPYCLIYIYIYISHFLCSQATLQPFKDLGDLCFNIFQNCMLG